LLALNLDQLIGFAGSANVQLAMISREKQAGFTPKEKSPIRIP
jgi:hypothetical protein